MKLFYTCLNISVLSALVCGSATAQHRRLNDTSAIQLDSVQIRENRSRHLPDVSGTYIFAGKRTFDIKPADGKANLASSNIRTIFSTIPGINVWEMSGNGFQINIGTRGTDTHRANETNMRQNGYITNSDIYGYPEDHYTPQYYGVQDIQVVRGAAALQFGPQFGGMVNFKMKEGDSTRTFSGETDQAVGSQHYFNSFTSVGGKSGKWSYYGYFASRTGDGYRPNSGFNGQWFYGNLKYQFNPKASLALQFSRVNFKEQDAGGLTDAQFNANPRQSTRGRNYFDPEINIPALLFNYDLSSRTHLEVTSHMIMGQRNSVQYLASPNVADPGTARQVDRDYYTGFTTEARLLTRYKLFGDLTSTLSGGLRYFTEDTKRDQKGTGTAGSDYNLTLTKPYGIAVDLNSLNYAAFVENVFQITSKLSITPGARFEVIHTGLHGLIDNATDYVNYKRNRNFPLFGAGLQYQVTSNSQLYGNIAQAYHPVTYAQIIPGNDLAVINPNLQDSKGYSSDIGYRGNINGIFNYDVDLYYAYYGNRIGNLTQPLANPTSTANTYIYTTNIGNGVAKGIEAYADLSLIRAFDKESGSDIKIFDAFSYDHARYTSGMISPTSGTTNTSLVGNWLEGTPTTINRAGITYLDSHITTTLQMSAVGKYYTDANNTVFNATGLSGIVPKYHVFDWSFNYNFLAKYHVFTNINNVLNAKYFTRRITILPGPGILPADGITFNIGLGMKF